MNQEQQYRPCISLDANEILYRWLSRNGVEFKSGFQVVFTLVPNKVYHFSFEINVKGSCLSNPFIEVQENVLVSDLLLSVSSVKAASVLFVFSSKMSAFDEYLPP